MSELVQNTDSGYGPRVPILTNEHGVVIPPPILECIGEECKFRNGAEACERNRHHLHSSLPTYEKAGDYAVEYRDLAVLTVWIPECQHSIHHGKHEIDVPVPSLEVMKRCTEEARIIRKMQNNHREIVGTEKSLEQRGITLRDRKGLLRVRDRLLAERPIVSSKVWEIEVLPDELVTGALIFAAPNHAKSRLIMGGNYVLTGTIPKEVIPGIGSFVEDVRAKAAADYALQTEVNRVELAA